ncbi:MAG: hypothetical protein E7058_10880 [Lentisphaerae bacterium]|nr:hypothetical protein [Lentisphaerota bacterium]
MKLFNILSVAAFSALVFCGCSDSPLAYVEKSADKVEYGNTENLNSDKGQAAQKQGLIVSDFLKEMKELLGDKEVSKLNFKYAVWSEIGKNKEMEKVGAVIILNEGEAKDLFDDLRKAYRKNEKYQSLKKEKVGDDELEAFAVANDKEGKNIVVSYVLVDDATIHVIYGDDPKVFKADGDNKFAEMIDESADLAEAYEKESKEDGDRIIKNEVFFTDEEIKTNKIVDITKIKDGKDCKKD